MATPCARALRGLSMAGLETEIWMTPFEKV
jgi:hypothetical protein